MPYQDGSEEINPGLNEVYFIKLYFYRINRLGVKLTQIKYMKRPVLSLVIIIFFTVSLVAQNTVWKPAGDKIKTKWAAEVNPLKPLIGRAHV